MEPHGGNIYRAARELGIQKEELIDFSSNINPLGIPARIKGLFRESIDEFSYYPEISYSKVKEALAQYNNISPELVSPGNGAIELIYLYLQQLKPKRALITAPTFSEYSRALSSVGSVIDHFPLREKNNFALESERLIEELGKGYELLVLCNPSNPTGSFTPLREIERIAGAAAKFGVKMLVDEAFIDFTGEMERASAILLKAPHIFVIRALTKFFALPGLRLGYALSYDRESLKLIESRRPPWSINSLAAIAAVESIEEEDYIRESIDFMNLEKRRLYGELAKIEGLKPYPPAVNFILIRLEGSIRSDELKRRLLEENILIRQAGNFQGLDESYIRVAVKSREANDRLIESLKRALSTL